MLILLARVVASCWPRVLNWGSIVNGNVLFVSGGQVTVLADGPDGPLSWKVAVNLLQSGSTDPDSTEACDVSPHAGGTVGMAFLWWGGVGMGGAYGWGGNRPWGVDVVGGVWSCWSCWWCCESVCVWGGGGRGGGAVWILNPPLIGCLV